MSSESSIAESSSPLLQMLGIRKAFPGVQALDSCSLDLQSGEIHALVGENGAGKSTLIKILTGVIQADQGEIRLDGGKVVFDSPIDAQKAGIAAIYQEFSLIPMLPVHANIFLGHEPDRKGFIDSTKEIESATVLFNRLGVAIAPQALVVELSVAHQQLVEIARALAARARILVMDEPTAALAPREVENLFKVLRDLKGQGMGIIFISHRIDEVFSIADRITVMRDGRSIGVSAADQLSKRELIAQMVGRPIEDEYPKVRAPLGEECFEVRNLSGGKVKGISFSVKHGEVLGLAGLMGAGRTETARLIFGADAKKNGEFFLDGQPLDVTSPGAAIRQGICLLTEDRKLQGLILKASAQENFAVSNLKAWSRAGFINQRKEGSRFLDRVRKMNIRVTGPDQKAENLSGGNQQKLLVARWLEANFKVIIFDEPTRGIDVGAKYELYLLINNLASQGKAIIVISSDLSEVLGISDRILVMKEGRITGEISDVEKAGQEDIMALAV